MKKVFIAIILLAFVGGWFFLNNSDSNENGITKQLQQEASDVLNSQSQESEVPVGTPTRITIAKIGVDAEIESVGMNEKGEMAVPQEDMNVAWYNLGYKPGDAGSAVVAGHFDTRTGNPAVFYDLAKLSNGDEIEVSYPDGKEYTFEVTDSELYPFNDFPLQKVFNTKGTPTLNLITCDGVFNSSAQNYSQRRVVYATLKE